MKNLTATAFFCLLSTAAFAQAGPQVRNVASFHAVEVGNGIELRLSSGATQRVVASADEADQLDRILTEVRDGVLKISFDREWAESLGLKNVHHLRVNVTATSLTALHASSGAHAEVLARVHHVTTRAGGYGAAREFCDVLLMASGRYAGLVQEATE